MAGPLRPPPDGLSGHPPARRGSAGFTMVELVVVLVLVGILGAIGASRFFDRSGFDVHTCAEQVRAMLRHAQKTAIARNKPVYVRFEDRRISLCNEEPKGACPSGAQVASPGGFSAPDEATREECGAGSWYCLGKPAGVAWSSAPSQEWLRFDALGRPFLPDGAPGALALAISGGKDSATVSVSEETGYVR